MNVTSATRSDIPELSRLLGTVFSEDPTMAEYAARSRDPRRALTRLFEALLRWHYLPSGSVDLVRDRDGQLLGAALWTPPRASLRKRSLLRLIPHVALALGPSLPGALLLYRRDSAFEPVFDHWYLFVIATSAAARGRGVGGALLDHGIERAGDQAIYLESTGPRSRALYERKGFVPLGAIGAPSGSQEIGMWRPGAVR